MHSLFVGSGSICKQRKDLSTDLFQCFQIVSGDGSGSGQYKCANCGGSCAVELNKDQMFQLGYVDEHGNLKPAFK
jgi:hypothetical protein